MTCKRCGACCMGFSTDGTDPDVCPQLSGEAGKQTSCLLHDNKPDGCTEFPPGCDCCVGQRKNLENEFNKWETP